MFGDICPPTSATEGSRSSTAQARPHHYTPKLRDEVAACGLIGYPVACEEAKRKPYSAYRLVRRCYRFGRALGAPQYGLRHDVTRNKDRVRHGVNKDEN